MSAPNSDRPVDVLGDFTIAGVLGEGGSGTVYDAHWGHRQVALKVMRAELPVSERDRFLVEARLLMDMTHPGVVKVLAAGTLPDGRPYLAMELLRGESLAERLARGPIALPEATALFVQLADAVAAMHARGLLHRDLKPENVMLVPGGAREHAVLLDFGIARAMDGGEVAPTQTGIVRGTPAYMAPERFFGQPATVLTDVYELAVTLFAMIAGRLPWADCIDPEVRLNPARLGDLAAVPAALDGELARALSTRATNRPPTVEALRGAVLAAVGGLAPTARQTADLAPIGHARTLAASVTPPPALAATPAAFGATPPRPSPNGMPAWTGGHAASVTTGNAAGERPHTGRQATRRRRWPWLVAALAVAAAAIAIPLSLRDSAPRSVTRSDDPWDVPVTPAKPGPTRTVEPLAPGEREALRVELAAAARHQADDLRSMLGVSLAELREDPALGEAVAKGARGVTFATMVQLLVGACDFDLVGRGRWLVLGVDASGDFDVVARGDWTREDIEACMMSGREGEVTRLAGPAGHADLGERPITRVPLDGPDGTREQFVGFLDDHTFVTTTREDADAAYVAARLIGDPPVKPSALTRAVDGLDREATLWVASNQAGVDDAMDAPELKGAELTARVVLGRAGADFAIVLTYGDAAAATRAEGYVKTQLAALGSGGLMEMALPGLVTERIGPAVRIAGQLPQGLLGSFGNHAIDSM